VHRRRHGHRDGGGGAAGLTCTVQWTIRREVLEQLTAHAREARPHECCGVLIGVNRVIVQARRAANLSDDPNRFELDPQAHVAAIRDTRGTAQSVVGFYHSHPHSPPVPSARDLAESTYPDVLHLIVGFPDAEPQTRAFILGPEGYREAGLAIEG